jgi:hypothetical protein
VFLKRVTASFSRPEDDLSPAQRHLFQTRNLDRLFKAYIETDAGVRIRHLALRRKMPHCRAIAVVRLCARRSLAERLRGANVADVDALLSLVLAATPAIAELTAPERPVFRTCARSPEKAAKKFPLRDRRPRDALGHLLRRPFRPSETLFLMAIVDVRPSSLTLSSILMSAFRSFLPFLERAGFISRVEALCHSSSPLFTRSHLCIAGGG